MPLSAQEPRRVEVGYEITFAGIAGFRIDASARFKDGTYDVESSTFRTARSSLTMNYFGRNRAWVVFTYQGAQPTAGSLSISVDRQARTWLAQYGPGGRWSNHTPDGSHATAGHPRVDAPGSLIH